MALSGGICPACGTYTWPKRFACRVDQTPLVNASLSGNGRLHAWTTIRVAPEGFEAPYVLAFAVLDEGPRVLCRMDVGALEGLRPDARVELELVDGAASGPAPGLVGRLADVAAEVAHV